MKEELILEQYTEKQVIDASLKWLQDALNYTEELIDFAADEDEVWLVFERNTPKVMEEYMDLDCDFLYNKGRNIRFANIHIVGWQEILEKYLN